MSLMNMLYVTLIVLILGAGIAVFFGIRAASAEGFHAVAFVADAEIKD